VPVVSYVVTFAIFVLNKDNNDNIMIQIMSIPYVGEPW